MKRDKTWTVSELADEFDVTPRTIRFYEEKGLLAPRRTEGNHRVYRRRDRARLKLILRGKRFGYALDEIADMIGPADRVDETEQIRRTLAYGERSLKEIRARREELRLLEEEITGMKRKLEARLRELSSV